jgi:hypothetical protein
LAHAVGENLEKVGEVVVSLSSPSSHYWQQIRGIGLKSNIFFSAFSQKKIKLHFREIYMIISLKNSVF